MIIVKEFLLSFCRTFIYLVKHKYYVFKYGFDLDVPVIQLIIHDYTKFYPSLFLAYSLWWQYQSEDKTRFNKIRAWAGIRYLEAFNKHQKTEKHHWQYFCLINAIDSIKVLEMPEKYVKEMVADWAAAGTAKFGRFELIKWYSKNENKINISDKTRIIVENCVKTLEKIYN